MKRGTWGQVVLEITSADCADILNRIQIEQIRARDIQYVSSLKFLMTISASAYRQIRYLVEKQGGTVRVKHISGIHKMLQGLKKHAVVSVVIVFLLVLTLWIPTRVFFISVDGNVTIPSNEIIEAAESCGLRFGTMRESVRSEMVKNALLQKIPQLQWVGVNTAGCTATISVREKTSNERKEGMNNQICSIVAIRDGIIQDCTVYRGNQLCQRGHAVKAGQILVSAYTDYGTMIKATQAEAEITALTVHELSVIAMDTTHIREREISKNHQYRLRVGKKLINLSKDSGNLDASCVKIYMEKSVSLPGGFVLPLGLVCETVVSYDYADSSATISEAEEWLKSYSTTFLRSSMISGEVLSEETKLITGNGFKGVHGRYTCMEMIGQVKYEQTLIKD